MDEVAGTRLGQFELCEIIRRGELSTIYKASQPALGRFVAVKVLHPVTDPHLVARFQLEARAIARLAHPNILPIYDYGEQDGCIYLAMQYIDAGATLADSLGAPMDPPTAIWLAARVLDALHHAHRHGVVHRDVKPANILMPSPTWPLLADFGIAKLLTRRQDPALTQQGFVVGTAAYMAPEQALGLPIDARTDVYALGVVLYEMATGQVPFDAGTPTAALARHAYEPPPPPRSVAPDLPASLEAVLLRALAKEPSDRYQTAAAMRDALERLEGPHPPSAAPTVQVTNLYASAIEAFRADHWEIAIERLEQVLALDADYEDAPELLAAAQRARATAPVLAPVLDSASTRTAVEEVQPRPEPVTPSPTPDRAGWRGRLLVGGAALLLLAAIVVAYAKHRPNASPAAAVLSWLGASPQTPSPVTAPIAGHPDFGRVRFSDGAGPLDTAVLTAVRLPPPPEGMRYEAWLLATATGERRSMGVIQVRSGGATAGLSADGSNLLASFDAFELTREPEADPSSSPSGDVTLRWVLPPKALVHIRNLLVSFDDTPGQVSLASGLLQAAGAAQREAERMLAARRAGDLDGVKRHAEALVNLIDGPQGARYGDSNADGAITGAGDGFGLGGGRRGGYLRAVQHEARLAAAAPDATPNVRLHAGHVANAADNLARWAAELRNLSLKITAARSIDQVRGWVDQATTLGAWLVTGQNGGAETLYQHAHYLADLVVTR